MPGTQHVGVGVTVPVSHYGEVIIGRAQEGIANQCIAAAEPVHTILVGVAGIATDDAKIVVDEAAGVFHLNGPGACANDASEAIDLDIVRLECADAVPVGFLHPAFIGVGILRAFVDDGAATQHFDAGDLPEVEAAVEVGARCEVVGFAALGIQALVIDARREDMNGGTGRRCGRRGRSREDKEHGRVIEKIAWT